MENSSDENEELLDDIHQEHEAKPGFAHFVNSIQSFENNLAQLSELAELSRNSSFVSETKLADTRSVNFIRFFYKLAL